MTSSTEQPSSPTRRTGSPVLQVKNLKTYLYTRWGVTKAVDDISFEVYEGETLGIVGESGCGKSMTALSMVRLTPKPASRIVGGEIILDGVDLLQLSEDEMRKVRGREISMILQDPQTSLNPVFTIGNQLLETISLHAEKGAMKTTLKDRAISMLRRMGVPAPERRMEAYPHQMSGGMKQRVVGGIAIESKPRVMIADEPTTALDVTIQAQYLRLLKTIQEETKMAIVFITHDFGVVAKMCDRVAVMYAGRIVEQGTVREVFNSPAHPYTQALMSSVPKMDEKVDKLYSIEGQPPALFDLPVGCAFAARCAFADARCEAEYPPTFAKTDERMAACWNMEGEWQPK
jgi:oligopeptide/dipeptide ABC transporter ATP-binding protein